MDASSADPGETRAWPINPLVIIAIPVLNSAGTLERSLRSAMAQTMHNIEILVIDDASTDDSADVADLVSHEDPRIRVIRLPANGGKARAMNLATSEARGLGCRNGSERMNGPVAATRVVVVSAADHRFMPLLRGMLASLPQAGFIDLACLDIGLTFAELDWLGRQGVRVVPPAVHFGLAMDDHPPTLRSFLARPFLPDYFPGSDVYEWLDSDVWLQDVTVLDWYIAGALASGFAIAHESDRGYRFQAWLLSRDHINVGMFAVRAVAPQWRLWADCYEAAIARTGALVPHDQFALNQALHRRPDLATFLDPGCNWICDRGTPMWNDAEAGFCKPYPPYAAIGALHLAGPAKRRSYQIRRTGGGMFETYIVHGAAADHPVLTGPLDAVAA